MKPNLGIAGKNRDGVVKLLIGIQGLYLIASDIQAARDELLGRGVKTEYIYRTDALSSSADNSANAESSAAPQY